MSCVPIAPIEYSDRVFVHGGEGLEEANEAALVIELETALAEARDGVSLERLTFSSGREAMVELCVGVEDKLTESQALGESCECRGWKLMGLDIGEVVQSRVLDPHAAGRRVFRAFN